MEIVLIIAVVILSAALVLVLLRSTKQPDSLYLGKAIQDAQQQTLQTILQQLNAQQQHSQHSAGQIHNRVDETSKAVYQLQSKLAQLEEGNKRILDMSKGITDLQNILQAPKLRGNQGEVWLETLLAQILPRQHFTMQHRFRSGETCDAVIIMPDKHLVPIDSKFSLENFRKMVQAATPEEQKMHARTFTTDVKKRIDEIAKKYILPDEGTLNFAFMYVPAENVYYQAFVEDSEGNGLQKYAFERHVIPVSPNSFYAYLEIVLFGLRGLQIEQSARDIHQQLSGIQHEFGKFREVYEKVGGHLRHAQTSFDQADKKLLGVESKLEVLSEHNPPLEVQSGE